jgi:predicted phage terminase large subunit-like protein
MGRPTLLNGAQQAEILRRYQAGLNGTGPRESYASLAAEFGTSVRPIRDLIKGGRPDAQPRTRGGPAAMAAASAPPPPPVDLPPVELAPAEPTEADDDPTAAIDTGALIRDLVDTGGLAEFIRIFWSECVPQTYCHNWHIDAICEYLEAVTLGQISRLVINVPPGHMKSLSVGVFWPAWMWTLDPKLAFLYGSFDQSLLNSKQSEPMIELINSAPYQAAYPYVQLKGKAPAMREFKNTAGGFRFNTSPEGKGTGRHVDYLVVDDPMKPQDAIGTGGAVRKAAFAKVDNWFGGTLPTRVRKAIVLIMQRVHTDDLAGQCLAKGYESLILPARMTRRPMWPRDPRKEVGELLWPALFPEAKIRELEIELERTHSASAQLQQDPTPATGGIVEEPWTRLEWVDPPSRGRWCSSWDFSAKGTSEAHSKVAGQLWCATRCTITVREYLSELNERLAKVPGSYGDVRLRVLGGEREGERIATGQEYYLLVDWVGGLWNYVTSKSQFTMAHARPLWKQHARIKLIELKANGIPLVEEFRDKFVGIKGIEPEGDKEERLRVHSEKFEAGQVVFAPGADPVREELVKFPRFTWDDQVDAATQALDHLSNRNARYRENLRKIAAQGGGLIL